MIKSKTFAIVGGGIGGLTLAIALQRRGFSVSVYENTAEIRPVGAGIVLAANALKAYRAIGIEKEIIAAGKEMKRFCVKDSKGGVLSRTDVDKIYKEYGTVTSLTLHRADLHKVLTENLQDGSLVLGKGCESFEETPDGVILKFRDGSSERADLVIAADGIHSIFRRHFLDSKLRYSGYTCWRGITDQLPSGFDSSEATESWGKGRRFGIVPLSKGRVYWFATVNAPEKDPVTNAYEVNDLVRLYRDFHFPIVEIIRGTPAEAIIKNDICDVPPHGKFAFGRIALLGDAAHATTPNLGQGACMAIEDAIVLANCLAATDDAETAFKNYESKRAQRTTRIVNSSFQLGRVAQVESSILAALRNVVMRSTPARVTDRQLRFLFDVSFS